MRLGLVLTACVLALVGCASSSGNDHDELGSGEDALTEDYSRLIDFAANHGMPPRSDRALVIGIRGRDTNGNLHPTTVAKVYDDTLLVLTPDQRVQKFAVSTHPWEKTGESPSVPDVSGDGKPDVGMIKPGLYQATRREAARNIAGAPTYQVLTASGSDKLPGWRNTDQNDAYSASEREASQGRDDGLTAVLFHQGGDGAPKAVGCQVLDAQSIRLLAEATGNRFDYLLVDANEEQVP